MHRTQMLPRPSDQAQVLRLVCPSDTVGEVAQPTEAPIWVRQQPGPARGKTGLFTAVGAVNEQATPTSPTVSERLESLQPNRVPSRSVSGRGTPSNRIRHGLTGQTGR